MFFVSQDIISEESMLERWAQLNNNIRSNNFVISDRYIVLEETALCCCAKYCF